MVLDRYHISVLGRFAPWNPHSKRFPTGQPLSDSGTGHRYLDLATSLEWMPSRLLALTSSVLLVKPSGG